MVIISYEFKPYLLQINKYKFTMNGNNWRR